MLKIEELAAEMFQRFALEETGRTANWNYLGKDRQKAWVKDVVIIADRLLMEIRQSLKAPSKRISKNATSFSMGYEAGKNEERVLLITILQKQHEDLIKEYKEFLEK